MANETKGDAPLTATLGEQLTEKAHEGEPSGVDLAERIAGARLVLVPGAGHLVMLEEPAAVAAAVEGFLAALAPAGA